MKKILIVENDLTIQKMILDHFTNKKFICDTASTVQESYDLLEKNNYDLIILDRVLDDGDGTEIAEFVNDFNYKTRIIFLSKKSKISEKIGGLEKGADDYLAKPFSMSELSIRVEKLLSKIKLKETESINLGEVKLFPESGEVKIEAKTKTMRKKELQILTCLFRHKNHVVSREMIINDVWPGDSNIPTHTTLDVYIRRIRIFLKTQKHLIKTVRGFGYMASLSE